VEAALPGRISAASSRGAGLAPIGSLPPLKVFEADLIYDVGLHKGEDSEFYLKKGFRVVAIEALPSLAQIATQRLREYVRLGQLIILNVAVAEKDGPITFFENPGNSVWGTTFPKWARRNERLGEKSRETTVHGMKFANILKEYGVPYYLKVDIEGADLLCLEGLKCVDSRPKYISIESSKTSWRDLCNEFALLTSLGYSSFKVIPQHCTILQECPFPAMEGRYVNHRFTDGASGLFGEETPGEWITRRQALKRYRLIFLRYRLFGDEGIARRSRLVNRIIRRLEKDVGWYDTHARITESH
jgi:FkbM family methyltransferase